MDRPSQGFPSLLLGRGTATNLTSITMSKSKVPRPPLQPDLPGLLDPEPSPPASAAIDRPSEDQGASTGPLNGPDPNDASIDQVTAALSPIGSTSARTNQPIGKGGPVVVSAFPPRRTDTGTLNQADASIPQESRDPWPGVSGGRPGLDDHGLALTASKKPPDEVSSGATSSAQSAPSDAEGASPTGRILAHTSKHALQDAQVLPRFLVGHLIELRDLLRRLHERRRAEPGSASATDHRGRTTSSPASFGGVGPTDPSSAPDEDDSCKEGGTTQ
jgi:hypothetical protein